MDKSNMNGLIDSQVGIRPTCYTTSPGYNLDIEILTMDSLRKKKNREFLKNREQINFHMLIFVTKLTCKHMVDIQSITCPPGSILILHPGQTHCFDVSTDWQGWLMLFRPEFLLPANRESYTGSLEVVQQLESLPQQIILDPIKQNLLQECVRRMWQDTRMKVDSNVLSTLLQNQLHAFLNRLYLLSEQNQNKKQMAPLLLKRFNRFRRAVEENFHHWHKVSDYTHLIGCSEKSLSRITHEISGISAKTYLSKRIIIEAKRYLMNTELPISYIAFKLGFNEVTNFTKFFKREAGCSPGKFRQRL